MATLFAFAALIGGREYSVACAKAGARIDIAATDSAAVPAKTARRVIVAPQSVASLSQIFRDIVFS